ncbi:MAG TPA: YkvA family protein [Micromonosporaceae bacterium]
MAKVVAGRRGRRAAFVALWRAVRAGRRPGAPGVGERLRALPRLLGARVRGRYTDLGWGRLALLVAAAGYVVSPVDVVPELVLAIPGLLDDTVIAAWMAGALLDETERFIDWERRGGSHAVKEPPSHPAPRVRP